ncbi:MAG: hypothetical protein ACREJ2_11060 [Planctomycetota bacterium]
MAQLLFFGAGPIFFIYSTLCTLLESDPPRQPRPAAASAPAAQATLSQSPVYKADDSWLEAWEDGKCPRWIYTENIRVDGNAQIVPGLLPEELTWYPCGEEQGNQTITLPDGRVLSVDVSVTTHGNGDLTVSCDGGPTFDSYIYDDNAEDDVYTVYRDFMLRYEFIYLAPTVYLHVFGERQQFDDLASYRYPSDEYTDPDGPERRDPIDRFFVLRKIDRSWAAVAGLGTAPESLAWNCGQMP